MPPPSGVWPPRPLLPCPTLPPEGADPHFRPTISAPPFSLGAEALCAGHHIGQRCGGQVGDPLPLPRGRPSPRSARPPASHPLPPSYQLQARRQSPTVTAPSLTPHHCPLPLSPLFLSLIFSRSISLYLPADAAGFVGGARASTGAWTVRAGGRGPHGYVVADKAHVHLLARAPPHRKGAESRSQEDK